jgi:hypothetical protein
MDVERMVKVYLKLREARSELKHKYDEEDGKLKQKQELLEGQFLAFLNSSNVDSFRTSLGTVYKQENMIPTAADWSAIYAWIKKHDAFEFLERRLKKTEVAAYMEEHEGSPPPGVNVMREYEVRIRRGNSAPGSK